MSVPYILKKLAKKFQINGENDFAANLLSVSEKISDKCSFCGEKRGKPLGKAGKKVCSTCSKKTACSLEGCGKKKMLGEMSKYGDEFFCCNECLNKRKTSIKSSSLQSMLKKYAQAKQGTYTKEDWENEVELPLDLETYIADSSDGRIRDVHRHLINDIVARHFEKTDDPIVYPVYESEIHTPLEKDMSMDDPDLDLERSPEELASMGDAFSSWKHKPAHHEEGFNDGANEKEILREKLMSNDKLSTNLQSMLKKYAQPRKAGWENGPPDDGRDWDKIGDERDRMISEYLAEAQNIINQYGLEVLANHDGSHDHILTRIIPEIERRLNDSTDDVPQHLNYHFWDAVGDSNDPNQVLSILKGFAEQEYEEWEPREGGVGHEPYDEMVDEQLMRGASKKPGKNKLSTNLKSMIKKYAQFGDDTFLDPKQGDLMADGFDSAMDDENTGGGTDNPYEPGTPEAMAWSQGYKAALNSLPVDMPDSDISDRISSNLKSMIKKYASKKRVKLSALGKATYDPDTGKPREVFEANYKLAQELVSHLQRLQNERRWHERFDTQEDEEGETIFTNREQTVAERLIDQQIEWCWDELMKIGARPQGAYEHWGEDANWMRRSEGE